MSLKDEEIENCQEAIVVIGEASESDDDYKSDLSLDSKLDNLNLTTFTENLTAINSKANSQKSIYSDQSKKKLSLNDQSIVENNLINDKLIKDNRQLKNSINNFGLYRYQKTINELNELNQNLIKSQEKILSTNQFLEKTRLNIDSLNDNLNEIFSSFNNIKLKI